MLILVLVFAIYLCRLKRAKGFEMPILVSMFVKYVCCIFYQIYFGTEDSFIFLTVYLYAGSVVNWLIVIQYKETLEIIWILHEKAPQL